MTAKSASSPAKKNFAGLRTHKKSFKYHTTVVIFFSISFRGTHTHRERLLLFKGFKNVHSLSRSYYVLWLFHQLDLFSKGLEIYFRAADVSVGPLEPKA